MLDSYILSIHDSQLHILKQFLWVGETNLCQNLRASNSKFGGHPLPVASHPESSLSGPTQPHLYSATYIQINNLRQQRILGSPNLISFG
jgi:hypothetical protein